jgi:hypothetical protein
MSDRVSEYLRWRMRIVIRMVSRLRMISSVAVGEGGRTYQLCQPTDEWVSE